MGWIIGKDEGRSSKWLKFIDKFWATQKQPFLLNHLRYDKSLKYGEVENKPESETKIFGIKIEGKLSNF